MQRKTRFLVAGAIAAVAIAGGAGIGLAAMGDDEDDAPITGPALQQASDAALKHVGKGRVTDTEAGDEEGAYEVEVTLDDGSQIDVHLDQNFTVIGTESDNDETED